MVDSPSGGQLGSEELGLDVRALQLAGELYNFSGPPSSDIWG